MADPFEVSHRGIDISNGPAQLHSSAGRRGIFALLAAVLSVVGCLDAPAAPTSVERPTTEDTVVFLPSSPDAGTVDTALSTDCSEPGGFGCACESAADCNSSLCVDGPNGAICTDVCGESCPTGFRCLVLLSTCPDCQQVCLPDFDRSCQPCQSDADCGFGRCRADGVCADQCTTSSDCLEGFECEAGPEFGECVPISGDCDCLPEHVGQVRACADSNPFGVCAGEQTCEATTGWSSCSARTPAAEVCNDFDDDCDGLADEGLECGPDPFCTGCLDSDSCGALECLAMGNGWFCSRDCAEDADCPDGAACVVVGDAQLCVHATGACAAPGTECMADFECEDLDQCTVDVCGDAGCEYSAVDCDDANVCTLDACDPDLGCGYQPVAGACDDGDPCTGPDECVDGTCSGGVTFDCDDGLACTVDSCVDGGCAHELSGGYCLIDGVCRAAGETPDEGVCLLCAPWVATDAWSATVDGTPCHSDEPCTIQSQCAQGACTVVTTDTCDDGNACTADSCIPGIGCEHLPSPAAPCDDGQWCTVADMCEGATCAGSARSCPDGDCLVGACDELADQCTTTPAPTGTLCDDGALCTADDACSPEGCIGDPIAGCCTADIACDDGNPCTVDVCELGGCSHIPAENGSPCGDGQYCTVDDVCTDGTCAGVERDCSVLNQDCQVGACDDTEDLCVLVPVTDGTVCDDGIPCTGGDSCQSGTCDGTALASCCQSATDCDDGNPCTVDACEPLSGQCVYQFTTTDGTPCEDGTYCTVADVCQSGSCVGTPRDCSPWNGECVLGTCNEGLASCIAVPNDGGTCNDGEPCTANDSCLSGACAGMPYECDDGLTCTTDVCDGLGGCQHLLNAGSCLLGGVCVDAFAPHPSLPCLACVPSASATSWSPYGGICDDGNACTVGDQCVQGSCAGTPYACDDGLSCTAESCDGAGGCESTVLPGSCLVAGSCVASGGSAPGNPCFACDPELTAEGWSPRPVGWSCDDQDSCTSTSACDGAGTCVGTPDKDTDADTYVDESCGGLDCDDLDPAVNPAASDPIDGVTVTPMMVDAASGRGDQVAAALDSLGLPHLAWQTESGAVEYAVGNGVERHIATVSGQGHSPSVCRTDDGLVVVTYLSQGAAYVWHDGAGTFTTAAVGAGADVSVECEAAGAWVFVAGGGGVRRLLVDSSGVGEPELLWPGATSDLATARVASEFHLVARRGGDVLYARSSTGFVPEVVAGAPLSGPLAVDANSAGVHVLAGAVGSLEHWRRLDGAWLGTSHAMSSADGEWSDGFDLSVADNGSITACVVRSFGANYRLILAELVTDYAEDALEQRIVLNGSDVGSGCRLVRAPDGALSLFAGEGGAVVRRNQSWMTPAANRLIAGPGWHLADALQLPSGEAIALYRNTLTGGLGVAHRETASSRWVRMAVSTSVELTSDLVLLERDGEPWVVGRVPEGGLMAWAIDLDAQEASLLVPGEEVDSAVSAGFELASGGQHRVVVYRDSMSGTVRVAVPGESWTLKHFEAAAVPSGGHFAAVRDGIGGHVVWYTPVGHDLYHATWTGDTLGAPALVDNVGVTGKYPALGLTADGVAVNYYNDSSDELRLATLTTGGWSVELIDSEGVVGIEGHQAVFGNQRWFAYVEEMSSSMRRLRVAAPAPGGGWNVDALDPGGIGNPRMMSDGSGWTAVYGGSEGTVRVSTSHRPGWTVGFETVVAPSGTAGAVALAAGTSPHLAWLDLDSTALRYARLDRGVWFHRLVDDSGTVGYYPSIAVDQNDVAHIAYRDYTDTALRYARIDATSTAVEVVDAPGNVGERPAIAATSTGLHIAYRAVSTKDIRAATGGLGQWTLQEVDAQGDTGHWPAVAADDFGLIHQAWFDPDDAMIHYRFGDIDHSLLTSDDVEHLRLVLDAGTVTVGWRDANTQETRLASVGPTGFENVETLGPGGEGLQLHSNDGVELLQRQSVGLLEWGRLDGDWYLLAPVASVDTPLGMASTDDGTTWLAWPEPGGGLNVAPLQTLNLEDSNCDGI